MYTLPGNVTLPQAARAMDDYLAATEKGTKVNYGPLIGCLDLVGLGDGAGTLPPGTYVFFEAGVGKNGCGFNAPVQMTWADTNFDGDSNQLSAQWAYWAHALGFHLPQMLPGDLKEDLLDVTAVRQRITTSDIWEMGPMWAYPCGEFGHSSPSVTTTIANTQIEYGQNGRVGMRNLPEGGELYFTALGMLHFEIQTYAPIFLTTNGLAPMENEENWLTHAKIYCVMMGLKFQRVGN